MKNISKLLQKAQLTPLERVSLLAHDFIVSDKSGKGVLSETDHAVLKKWRPANTYEAKEYNKHLDTLNLWHDMGVEAYTYYLHSINKLLRQQGLFDYMHLENKFIDLFVDKFSTSECLEYLSQGLCINKSNREQIDKLIPFTRAFLFIQKYSNPAKTLNTLKEFKNLAQKTSDIFDCNMHEKYEELCNQYEEELLFLNLKLIKVLLKICKRENIELRCTDNIFKFDLGCGDEIDPIMDEYTKN